MSFKGKNLTDEAIEKMKQSKLKKMLSKYNWSIVEPYLDVELEKSKRNRKLIFITLREFKDYLLSGLSSKDMKKKGICKHLLQFFGNFCQNKIRLDKSIFEQEYLSGLSLEEISKKYNITREDITFLRQLYNIKVKGATFQNRKNTEIDLTQRQKEIVYGSLLGDAKKVAPSSVGFGQCERQKKYLIWKYKEMKSVVSKNSLKRYISYDKRSGKTNISWRFYSASNTDVENIISEFYKNGHKEISQKILDNLTPLSLAVWYMDDGRTCWKNRKKSKYSPECQFCTDSFSEESLDLAIEWLKNKYNIDSHKRQRGKTKLGQPRFRIILKSASIKSFFDLIGPYFISSMSYKINFQSYLKWRKENKKLGRYKNQVD